MSGRISIAFVDFAAFSFGVDRVRGVSFALFLVRWNLDLRSVEQEVGGSSPPNCTSKIKQLAKFLLSENSS